MSKFIQPITKPWKAWALLTSAIVGGIFTAILLGITLDNTMRIILGLSNETIASLVPAYLFLLFLIILTTLILVAAFYIENKVIKAVTIGFSLIVPSVIEVIDLSIRAIHIFIDISNLPYI
jgi:hypothetical protein